MHNAGRGYALGRGRGRGVGFAPPPPPYHLGAPPQYPPPFAVPAAVLPQRNHDGERVSGSKVPHLRDLADDAKLEQREHWLDHVFTELAACGSGIRMCFQNRRQLQSVNHDQNYDVDPRLNQHFEHVDIVVPKAMSMMLNSSPENLTPVTKNRLAISTNYTAYPREHFQKVADGPDLAERRSRALLSMRAGGIDGLGEWL